jgi:hypothetical protein
MARVVFSRVLPSQQIYLGERHEPDHCGSRLAEQDDPPSLWAWDCLQGHRCLSDTAQTSYLGSPDDTVQAPALLLKKAMDLPPNSVLFCCQETARSNTSPRG